MMKTLELANANDSLSHYARGLQNEPVIITSHGKPIAALITVHNVDWETIRLSTSKKFLSIVERSRAHLRTHGGISSVEMRQRLGVKPNGRKGGRHA